MRIRIRSTYSIGAACGLQSPSGADGSLVIEVQEGATVRCALLKMSGIGSPCDWDDMLLIVIVNGTLRGFDHVLADNDVIDLHIPVSGG